jgi:hypothetical protein
MVEAGEWLNLADASHRMKVSIQTLRRRIKKRKIQSRQVDNPFGKSYEVWVDHDYTPEQEGIDLDYSSEQEEGVDKPSPKVGDPANLELIRLVDRLQRENRELVEAATVWQARAGMLMEHLSHTQLQLTEAQQAIKVLEAPKVELKVGESREVVIETKPWWKFW